jgi:hypothetical protein
MSSALNEVQSGSTSNLRVFPRDEHPISSQCHAFFA